MSLSGVADYKQRGNNLQLYPLLCSPEVPKVFKKCELLSNYQGDVFVCVRACVSPFKGWEWVQIYEKGQEQDSKGK